jgi:hypothetical protein
MIYPHHRLSKGSFPMKCPKFQVFPSVPCSWISPSSCFIILSNLILFQLRSPSSLIKKKKVSCTMQRVSRSQVKPIKRGRGEVYTHVS